MPEYLAPGVFVEESSFRHKSIEGVGTSVAGLVGPTRSGPLEGTPEVVTSYPQFERVFGDARPLMYGNNEVPNYTAHAARAFFDNGGKQLFVVRVLRNGDALDADGAAPDATAAARTADEVTFGARFLGKQGEFALHVRWRDSENLLRTESADKDNLAEGRLYFLRADGLPKDVTEGPLDGASFPVNLRAIVRRAGTKLVVDSECAQITSVAADTAQAASGITAIDLSKLPAGSQLSRSFAKAPASGDLADGALAVLHFKRTANLAAFSKAAWSDELRTLHGTLNAAGDTLSVKVNARVNPGVTKAFTLPLSALAHDPDATSALFVLRDFDVEVLTDPEQDEIIQVYPNISLDPSSPRSLNKVMPREPQRKFDALESLVYSDTGSATTSTLVSNALYKLFDTDELQGKIQGNRRRDPRFVIALEQGSDGASAPLAIDYAGKADELTGGTGLAALEAVEDVAIVMAPAAAADQASHQAVVLELQKHCNKMRYRVGLVDSRVGMSIGEVRTFRDLFSDTRLALYHPWVVIDDPIRPGNPLSVPPAGFIAGVYARTDVDRGVHKAPANEVVFGALRLEQNINRFQQELLNPNGINCLRSFPGRGHRVWGGRTLSPDPEWIYVNVRRYFLYLERSIEKSTQWAVFEPNGERLWANIRSTVEDFLFNEWTNGRLLGDSPKLAYFVRCDRSTMTQNDLDNGRLVCVVGVAPLRPAEFVIFRVGQKTASA